MTGVDPVAPVLIGAGQVAARDRTAPSMPVTELLAVAARRALADAEAGGPVQARLTTVGVTHSLSAGPGNPAGALATVLGSGPVRTVVTQPGGTGPLDLLHDAARRISAGEGGVTLLAGGEAIRWLRENDTEPPVPGASPPDEVLGEVRAPSHPVEHRAGLYQPLNYYPLFESAIRGAAGRVGRAGMTEHQEWLGELWGRYAAVGAANPYGCVRGPAPSAEQIATAGPGNRMVAHPYPKLMTANIQVDQAAAVVLCSAATAESLGVPRERWVFVAAGAAAHDHWFPAEREFLHRSPAIQAVGTAVLGHAGRTLDDIDHLDLYACFPSAVQIAAAELGVDLRTRTPSVTGGLTFAGGPASSYSFHAIATLVERLRTDGGTSAGLATAVGWFLTKHAATVLTAAPPRRLFAVPRPQSAVDRRLCRKIAEGDTQDATVEAWTVTYDYEGVPVTGHLTALGGDGERAVASTTAPSDIAALLDADPLGAQVRLTGEGTFAF